MDDRLLQPLNSRVYCGKVMHHRFWPKKHRFIYSVFSLLLDLDELKTLDNKLRWFSLNRFNLFSFQEKDYGRGQGTLKDHLQQLLERQGFSDAGHRIEILCYPRILGYVFNPLSVYFCYDQDEQLRVVIYEVTNTFRERHCYLLEVENNDQVIRQYCRKKLYVSPFTPEISEYNFRIHPPKQRIAICISQHEDQQRLLHATFTGKASTFSNGRLLSLFFKYPLMTIKVIGAIHWEALRLWLKGNPIYRHQRGQTYSLSWQDKQGVRHYEVL